MTLSQRAVEAAARAAYHATPRNKPYDVLTLHKKNLYRAEAQAALNAALAVDGLCLVPKEDLAVVLHAASLHYDEGPAGEGWQSSALECACENVEKCLAAANDGEERSSPPEGKI